MADAWITVREGAPGSAPVTTTTGVSIGQQVTVGRAGHIVVGVDVADSGISRVVATITATPQGWTVRDTSRNGIVIHPWGLAPLRATTDVRLHWPLIGLRVLGAEPDTRHWLLLECDEYAIDAARPEPGRRHNPSGRPTPATHPRRTASDRDGLRGHPRLATTPDPGRATATQAGQPSTRHQRLRPSRSGSRERARRPNSSDSIGRSASPTRPTFTFSPPLATSNYRSIDARAHRTATCSEAGLTRQARHPPIEDMTKPVDGLIAIAPCFWPHQHTASPTSRQTSRAIPGTSRPAAEVSDFNCEHRHRSIE